MLTLRWHPAPAGRSWPGVWLAAEGTVCLWLTCTEPPAAGGALPPAVLAEALRNCIHAGRVQRQRVVAVDAIDRQRWRVYVRPVGGVR